MTKSVSIAHLKAHLAQVVGEVQSNGRSVVIEKRGRPIAMLVPIDASRPAGLLGLVGAFEDAPGFGKLLDEVVKGRRKDKKRRVPRPRVTWVFDTDVVSVLLRSRVHTTVHERLARTPVEAQAVTSITVGEVSYGASKAGRPDLLDRALSVFATMQVLPFDDAAARVYGPLRARLEKRGAVVAEADLRIGAIALSRGAVLVTGNVKHFARIDGLKVENWLR